MTDENLKIEKQVWVKTPSNRDYSIDRHKGKDGKPDYYVLTEHKASGGRYRVMILAPDLMKVANALIEASR